jgi:hypothetical protein
MTIPQIIAAVWLTVGPVACVLACSTFHASSRADDLSRTRNNAAGEKGEGDRAAGHLVQRNKSKAEF